MKLPKKLPKILIDTKSQFKILSAALLALTLAACGTQTNPTSGYGDLRNAGKPQSVPVKAQYELGQICPAPMVDMGAGALSNLTLLNFSEGNAGHYVIAARCVFAGVQYNLIAKGLPADASFARNPANPDQFLLDWNPKKGTVPHNSERPRDFMVTLEYQITAYPTDQFDIKAINGKAYQFTISVTSRAVSPLITAVKVASDSITQGDKVAITIEAQDPAAVDGQSPSLNIADDDSGATDVGVIPASSFVKFDAPQALGGGKYVFNGTLDTASLDWAWKKRGDVTARILVALQTADGHQSSEAQVNVKILKKADPIPAPQPQSQPQKPAPAPKKKGGKK